MILLVDPDTIWKEIFIEKISPPGVEVAHCSLGKRALDVFVKFPISVIVTELDLPDMDGIDLVKTIRLRRELSSLPIVVLSKRQDRSSVENCLNCGVNSYLNKFQSSDRDIALVITGFV